MSDDDNLGIDGLSISVSFPCGLPNKNCRIYPPEVMKEAIEKAAREGTLKVEVGGTQEPILRSKPVKLGNRRYIDPKMTILSMDLMPDGDLQGVVEIEEQAGVVDQLAAVARPDEPTPDPRRDGLGLSSKSKKLTDGDGQTR